jgi:hypothetical protein
MKKNQIQPTVEMLELLDEIVNKPYNNELSTKNVSTYILQLTHETQMKPKNLSRCKNSIQRNKIFGA